MSITAVFSLLLAISKAIPVINDWIESIVSLWIDHKIKNHKEELNLRKMKMKALQKAILNAKTDQERIALSVVLHDVNKLPHESA